MIPEGMTKAVKLFESGNDAVVMLKQVEDPRAFGIAQILRTWRQTGASLVLGYWTFVAVGSCCALALLRYNHLLGWPA